MADLDIALDHLLHLLLQADLCIVHSYKSKMLCLHTFFDLFIHAQGISPLTAHKKADAVLISYVYRHQLFVAEKHGFCPMLTITIQLKKLFNKSPPSQSVLLRKEMTDLYM